MLEKTERKRDHQCRGGNFASAEEKENCLQTIKETGKPRRKTIPSTKGENTPSVSKGKVGE